MIRTAGRPTEAARTIWIRCWGIGAATGLPTLSLYLLCQVASGLVPAVSVTLTARILDRLAQAGSSAGDKAVLVAIVATGLAATLLVPASRYLQDELGRKVSLATRSALYRRLAQISSLSTLESPEFQDRLRVAEQASRDGPAQIIDSSLGAARAAITIFGIAATVWAISPWVALIMLASGVPTVLLEVHLNERRYDLAMRTSQGERREIFYSELLMDIRSAAETRLFDTGNLFHARMVREIAGINSERRRIDRREAAYSALMGGVAALVAGTALTWAVHSARTGALSVGKVGAVLTGVAMLQAATVAAVGTFAQGHRAQGFMADYFAIIDSPEPSSAAVSLGPSISVRPTSPGLVVDHVWFRYDDGQPWILQGVDLAVAPGETLAVVGANGAGKSTLMKLLCRLYEPTSGAIYWDGIDIRQIEPATLRARMSAVFQDFMCYELTAEENVTLATAGGAAQLHPDREQVRDACRQVGLDDALSSLPRGYDTLLSRIFYADLADAEHGVSLSGGQWQRLAFARALHRGARELLILDEPTSGLDVAAESTAMAALEPGRGQRMTIIITHRMSSARRANRIVLLEGGVVAECGDHDTLLRQQGQYAEMFAIQAAGYATR